MMTKEQFINWFNKGEEYRKTLLKIEELFSAGEIFESAIGRFYDEYIDMPNFSDDAKDMIGDFIWNDSRTRWYFNETESVEVETVEELYYAVMEFSGRNNMIEQIDYILPNVCFSCATLWFPGYAHECVNAFELDAEEAEAIAADMNEYIKTHYPNRDVVVHYDNEKFNLWNNEPNED